MRSIKRRHATLHGDRDAGLMKELFAGPNYLPKDQLPDPIKLNLLALRTKDKSECEICDHFSTLVCSLCKVTYYCSAEHCEMDRDLHKFLCSALATLRSPKPFSANPETREQMKKQYDIRLKEIYNFTYLKGMVALVEGQYEFAIASAKSSYKTANEAYGPSIESILPKTILTEAFLKMNKYKEAQQSMVDCLRLEIILEDAHVLSNKVRAEIRHAEGLISLSQQQNSHARYCFAEEIYLYSVEYDPAHIRTATAYSNLGETFINEDTSVAQSLIRKSVGIWTTYFSDKLKEIAENITTVHHSLDADPGAHDRLIASVSMSSRNETEDGIPEKVAVSCDVNEGLNTLTYCKKLLFQMFGSKVEIMDRLENAYAKAQILFCDNELYKVKNKLTKAIQMCEKHSIESSPIYKQLLKLNKDTDRRLYAIMRSRGTVLTYDHSYKKTFK